MESLKRLFKKEDPRVISMLKDNTRINDALIKGMELGSQLTVDKLNSLIEGEIIHASEAFGPLDPEWNTDIKKFLVKFDWEPTTDDNIKLIRVWK